MDDYRKWWKINKKAVETLYKNPRELRGKFSVLVTKNEIINLPITMNCDRMLKIHHNRDTFMFDFIFDDFILFTSPYIISILLFMILQSDVRKGEVLLKIYNTVSLTSF